MNACIKLQSTLFSDDEYMYAVKKSFVFLKENINFEYMEHWLIQNDIITTKEIEDYITQDKAIHFRSERLLKWLIWKRKCKAFVLILDEMRCDNHIPEEIARQINNNLRETQSSLTGNAFFIIVKIFRFQRKTSLLFFYLSLLLLLNLFSFAFSVVFFFVYLFSKNVLLKHC